ncbi:MAG: mechanosensitive ion channel domain-containing protein [Pseudomonadota bacterium]
MTEQAETTAEEVAENTQAATESPADEAPPTFAEQSVELIDMAERLLNRLLQPWSAYQLLIILGIAAFSYCLYLVIRPKVRAFLGASHGWPKWLLRVLAVVNRRLSLLIFVIIAWSVVYVMREVTWPSRSYFVNIAALLATWFFIIAVISRLIRSTSLRAAVRWVGWIYATLEIFGITETVTTALDSVALSVGELRISALTVVTAVLSLAALFAVASFLSKEGSNRISRIDDMSPSIRVLLVKALQVTLYAIAFLIALRVIGFDIGNLALLSGAIGLGIGFGLQKIVSNLVSGVIILLDKSIKPGDVISLGSTFGWITQLGARYASVLTRDGREYLIPNEDFITMQVVNWSHSSDLVRLDIEFGVSYDSDPHLVRKIAAEAPLSVKRIVKVPKPVCHITGFGASSIDFILRFWIRDSTGGLTNVRGEVFLALWDVLKENDIEIPFSRLDLHVRDDSHLKLSEPLNTALPKD